MSKTEKIVFLFRENYLKFSPFPGRQIDTRAAFVERDEEQFSDSFVLELKLMRARYYENRTYSAALVLLQAIPPPHKRNEKAERKITEFRQENVEIFSSFRVGRHRTRYRFG